MKSRGDEEPKKTEPKKEISQITVIEDELKKAKIEIAWLKGIEEIVKEKDE